MLISENSKNGYDDLVVLLHETIKSKENINSMQNSQLNYMLPVLNSSNGRRFGTLQLELGHVHANIHKWRFIFHGAKFE